ncbi:vesicle-associated protein 4-2-like isoform X2 [Amaranthus tricolor]|uniref:vesicle-associated protein 4-2-like isoform X2 n=1 Tax=Amaranthus tricolor TaxID=29722 RepID=UPI00258FC282|nr:vesicle-associated protein 4-2-like isoform X2 [Amaranthus tricolor]
MAMAGERSWSSSDGDEDKVLTLCKLPFWQFSNGSHSSTTTTSSSSQFIQPQWLGIGEPQIGRQRQLTVSSIAKSLIPPRRKLRLDPPSKLYFPYEPGKQVRSAITIKNISKSHVAFKFQTTAPKSCYMRPPGGILAPGESLVAVVFKFVEPPENNEKPLDQKSKVKFKIMSLKVKGVQFEEQRDQVSIEQIMRVVFLDAERPSPALEKLKRQLAEADAMAETRKKPQEDVGTRIGGEGLVIDEWKERRERYLAQQHGEASCTV